MSIRAVPTLLVGGPTLQARTDVMLALLQHKPSGVRWAVLTQPRLVSLASESDEVAVQSAPPGCACCVGNVPFRVVLTRLMRDARPDGLIVELGASDHREQVERMFADPWFSQAIDLIATVDGCQRLQARVLARRLRGRAA